MLGQPAAAAHLAGVLALGVPLILLSAASAFCFQYCCSVSSALWLKGSAYDPLRSSARGFLSDTEQSTDAP